MKRAIRLFIVVLIVGIAAGVYFAYPWMRTRLNRNVKLFEFFSDPSAHPEWMVRGGERCGDAPFLIPTDSYIGFIWGDVFRPGKAHQGLDMFSFTERAGETPVYAAYPGYLTRLPDWKSTLIIRIPEDPLKPGRQIWTYYTHLADRDGNDYIVDEFPQGTSEVYVEAGTLLGYQGDYSGDPFNPTGVHLHFSIVLDEGVSEAHPLGWFTNELDIRNTLDPSPYLGLPLNASQNPDVVPVCTDPAEAE